MKLAISTLALAAAAHAAVITYNIGGTYSGADYLPAEMRGQAFAITKVFDTLACGQEPYLGFNMRCGEVQFDFIRPESGLYVLSSVLIHQAIPGYDQGQLWLYGLSRADGRAWETILDPLNLPAMSATLEWVVDRGDRFLPGNSLTLVNDAPGTIGTASIHNPEPGTWVLLLGPLAWWGWRRCWGPEEPR